MRVIALAALVALFACVMLVSARGGSSGGSRGGSSGGSRGGSSGRSSGSSRSSGSRSSSSRSSSSRSSSSRSSPSRSSPSKTSRSTASRSTPSKTTRNTRASPAKTTRNTRASPAKTTRNTRASPAKTTRATPAKTTRAKTTAAKPAKAVAAKPAKAVAAKPAKAVAAKPNKAPIGQLKVDKAFIAKVEGGYIAKGYVPTKNGKAIGKSGVTIANGLDLGQRTHLNDLKANGLSPATANKLSGYLGKTKDAAIASLKANPLSLSKAETAEVAAAVSKTYDGRVASSFNKMGGNFASLPGNVQTALASVAHQYGSIPSSVAKPALAGNYEAAAKALTNMKGYAGRRAQEAALMRA